MVFHFDVPVPATETVEQKHANEQRYREEERALTREAQVPTFEGMAAFIDSLGKTGLTGEQLSAMALPTFDPASFSDQTWGIIKAGATAYGTSFMVGKILINYLALAGKDAGLAGWGAFPLAGVLNEIVSAPLAGAIRANHGTYGSPDGAASANYHTANASLLAARISGNQAEIEKCRNNLSSCGFSNRQRQKAGRRR